MNEPMSVEVPVASRLNDVYATTHLADAYEIDLPDGASNDPETLARFLFAEQPAWATKLMKVRDVIVSGLGLKTSGQLTAAGPAGATRRVGIFRIYETLPNEIVMGEDDKHLDFRLSVLCEPQAVGAGDPRRLVVSTVVHCHNFVGRTYIRMIEPFHRRIIQASLRRAARAGWPSRAST